MTLTTERSQSWADCMPRVQARFPKLRVRQAPCLLDDREAFVAYLAQTQHLTMYEANQEVSDFLYIEGLRREVDEEPADQVSDVTHRIVASSSLSDTTLCPIAAS